MRNFEENYINAAHDDGLYERSTALEQAFISRDVIRELVRSVVINDRDQIIEGIGKSIVHLTHLAFMSGSDLTECMARAWAEIESKEKV